MTICRQRGIRFINLLLKINLFIYYSVKLEHYFFTRNVQKRCNVNSIGSWSGLRLNVSRINNRQTICQLDVIWKQNLMSNRHAENLNCSRSSLSEEFDILINDLSAFQLEENELSDELMALENEDQTLSAELDKKINERKQMAAREEQFYRQLRDNHRFALNF